MDIASGRELKEFGFVDHGLFFTCFSPDGTKVAAACGDTLTGWVWLWDVKTGELVRTYTGHNGNVGKICFSPDGKSIASCSYDGTIKIWKIPEDSGVNENKSDNKKLMLNIFPNPATNRLNFSYKLNSDLPLSYSVYSILGNCILSVPSVLKTAGENEETIETNTLTGGIYYLKLSAGSEVSTAVFSVIR